jgi:hypothetical protein
VKVKDRSSKADSRKAPPPRRPQRDRSNVPRKPQRVNQRSNNKMSTAEQKRAADLRHIIENVLLDYKPCYQCLKSIGIKQVSDILDATPKELRAATYTEDDGTTASIPSEIVNALIALTAYIKWRNLASEINERIGEDYNKITVDDLDYSMRGSVFHTNDGRFCYDCKLGKMTRFVRFGSCNEDKCDAYVDHQDSSNGLNSGKMTQVVTYPATWGES